MQIFEKRAWEKRLRASVSVAVLCCTLPNNAFAWLPDVTPTAKYVPVDNTTEIKPQDFVTRAPALALQAKPDTIKTVAATAHPIAVANVTLYEKADAKKAFLPAAAYQLYHNTPAETKALAEAEAQKKTQIASAAKPTPAPVHTVAAQPVIVANAKFVVHAIELTGVQPVMPHPYVNAKLPWSNTPQIAMIAPAPALPADKKPEAAQVALVAIVPKTAELAPAPGQELALVNNDPVWRDEKEAQPAAVAEQTQHVVLTPPQNEIKPAIVTIAQAQPISAAPINTKTTIEKLEIASDEHIVPASRANAFSEQEALAQVSPAAGGEPTILMPPKSAPMPADQLPPAAPLKLTLPGNEPVTAPVVTEQDATIVPDTQPALVKEHGLSQDSKDILDRLPPEPADHFKAKKPVTLERGAKNTKEESVKKHEAYGMKIAVKRPKTDIFRALESAYNALIAGDQQYAITQYKEVLDEDPENTMALFGLATTYHRAGQIKLARPLYAQLLEIDPHNVEGLNNFLVLLADESPNEALVELGKMQRSHPGFSPVPAQMSLIYEKQGDFSKAAEKMAQAISITPENLKYQYNMAVIYDKMGDWPEAAKWYQGLMTANERGEKIPGNPQEIQQRLTFILSNRGSHN